MRHYTQVKTVRISQPVPHGLSQDIPDPSRACSGKNTQIGYIPIGVPYASQDPSCPLCHRSSNIARLIVIRDEVPRRTRLSDGTHLPLRVEPGLSPYRAVSAIYCAIATLADGLLWCASYPVRHLTSRLANRRPTVSD